MGVGSITSMKPIFHGYPILNNTKMIMLKYGYMDIQSKTLKHLLATSNMEVFLALKYSSITLNSLEPITTSLERIPNLLPIG